MEKTKKLQTHHLYLGAGGMLAVATLVIALTFGFSSAQEGPPPGGPPPMDQPTPPTPPTPPPSTPPPSTPPPSTPPPSTPPPSTPPPGGITCTPAGGDCCSGSPSDPDCGGPSPGADPCPGDACPNVCCGAGAGQQCQPPFGGCQTGTWNQARCMCEGGQYSNQPPPANNCQSPPNGCSAGQFWDAGQCMCKPTSTGNNEQQMNNMPLGDMSACTASGGVWCPGRTPDQCKRTPGSCDSSQQQQQGVCSGSAIICSGGGAAAVCVNGAWQCGAMPPNTCAAPNIRCPDGQCVMNQTQCGSPPPASSGKMCGQPSCPSNPNAPRWCDGVTSSVDPHDCGCGRNEPCRVGGEQLPPPAVCSGNPIICSGGAAAVCMNGTWQCVPNMMNTIAPTRICRADEEPSFGNPCFKPMMKNNEGCPRGEFHVMGRCVKPGDEMKQCPGMVSCPVFDPQGNPVGMKCVPQPPANEFGEGVDACAYWEQKDNQFKFNADEQKGKYEEMYKINDLRNRLVQFLRDGQYKQWTRDIKQIKAEISRSEKMSKIKDPDTGEYLEWMCPVTGNINGLLAEMEEGISKLGNVKMADLKTMTKEQMVEFVSLIDHLNGGQDPETQEPKPGVFQILNGYGGQFGEHIPGKREGMGMCGEVAGMRNQACDMSKRLSREYSDMSSEDMELPDKAKKAYEYVLPRIAAICNDPWSVLAENGVNIEEPWQPDSDICGGGWSMPGPMPMNQPNPAGFGGGYGQPNFIPQGDFPMGGAGQANPSSFNLGGGFNPAVPWNSALLALPENEEDGFEEGDSEEFDPGEFEDFEEFGMPEECVSPVQKYLNPHKYMKILDRARESMRDYFENMDACKMFKQGKKQKRVPPEVKEMIEEGLAACQEGDTEKVQEVKYQMMQMFRGGPPGEEGFRGAPDEAFLKNVIKESMKDILGEKDRQIAELTVKLESLSADLRAVIAMNQKLLDLTAKLDKIGVSVEDAGSQTVLKTLDAREGDKGDKVAERVTEIAEVANEIINNAPSAVDNEVRKLMDVFTAAPPSVVFYQTVMQTLDRVNSIVSSGGADAAEAAIDMIEGLKAANEQDMLNKKNDGTLVCTDAWLDQWYTPQIEKAKYTCQMADLDQCKPGDPETLSSTLLRACRLKQVLNPEFRYIDSTTIEQAAEIELVKKAPGLAPWAVGCVSELQKLGVSIALNPPIAMDQPLKRRFAAEAFAQVLDLQPNRELLTSDVSPNDSNADAISAMIAAGAMKDTGDGNWSPDVVLNRAQMVTVQMRLGYEHFQLSTEQFNRCENRQEEARGENENESAAGDEEESPDFSDFDFGDSGDE